MPPLDGRKKFARSRKRDEKGVFLPLEKVPLEQSPELPPLFDDIKTVHEALRAPKKRGKMGLFKEVGHTKGQQALIVSWLKGLGYADDVIARAVVDIQSGEPIGMENLSKEFQRELDLGRQLALAKVASRTFQIALWGDEATAVKAQQLILRSQAGWRETIRTEHTGANGGPIRTENMGPDISMLNDDELRELESIFARAEERLTAEYDTEGGEEGAGDEAPERLH